MKIGQGTPDEMVSRWYKEHTSKKIKMSKVDLCDVDCNFNPMICNEYLLLKKAL